MDTQAGHMRPVWSQTNCRTSGRTRVGFLARSMPRKRVQARHNDPHIYRSHFFASPQRFCVSSSLELVSCLLGCKSGTSRPKTARCYTSRSQIRMPQAACDRDRRASEAGVVCILIWRAQLPRFCKIRQILILDLTEEPSGAKSLMRWPHSLA